MIKVLLVLLTLPGNAAVFLTLLAVACPVSGHAGLCGLGPIGLTAGFIAQAPMAAAITRTTVAMFDAASPCFRIQPMT
jgi:hypothetical protein